MLKIGYIGLGAMGGALSRHLAGHVELTVFDRNPSATDALVALGASKAASARELAEKSDIIVLCLPRSSDVESALFGPDGLAAGLSAGKLVIDQTSGVPKMTSAMFEKLKAMDVAMLDAPLSGGIPAAQNGTVSIIVSGAESAWTTAEPVLRAMSSKVYYTSERVGDAQALKLVNNAIGAAYRMATLELVALGRKSGLELGVIANHLEGGAGANFTCRGMLRGMVEGRSTTDFSMALMLKDLNEAVRLDESGMSALPMTRGARGLMQVTSNLYGASTKLEDVIRSTETLAGVKFAAEAEQGGGTAVTATDPDRLLEALEMMTLVCNLLAVCECVELGVKFGLPITRLEQILNNGSAWSRAGEMLLSPLARGEKPALDVTLGQAESAAKMIVEQAVAVNVPIMLPNTAFSRITAACEQFGEDADLAKIAETFRLN